MVLAVKITFDAKSLQHLMKTLPNELGKEVGKAGYKYTTMVANSLRRGAINDPLRRPTPERKSAAMKIKAKKLSKFKSVVTMPRSLVLLDSMSPHYVSLKRGRNITKWANRHSKDGVTVSGRSNVLLGPRGGVRGGFLFVTPHRFVAKSIAKERNKLGNELRKGVKKAFAQSKK